MKNRLPCTFPCILDHLSQIWEALFWPSGQGCQKCAYIFKVTSNGRAEIQNGLISCFMDTFNLSSVIRGHFWNVNTLKASLATCSKKKRKKENGLQIFEPTCANCTVGSYASLSACKKDYSTDYSIYCTLWPLQELSTLT